MSGDRDATGMVGMRAGPQCMRLRAAHPGGSMALQWILASTFGFAVRTKIGVSWLDDLGHVWDQYLVEACVSPPARDLDGLLVTMCQLIPLNGWSGTPVQPWMRESEETP